MEIRRKICNWEHENGTLRLRGEKRVRPQHTCTNDEMRDPHGEKIQKKMEHKQQARLGKIQPSSTKMGMEKLNNCNKIVRELRNIMEETIGNTTVIIRKTEKNKESGEIKKLRMERKTKWKEFQEVITKNGEKGKTEQLYRMPEETARQNGGRRKHEHQTYHAKNTRGRRNKIKHLLENEEKKVTGRKGTSNCLTITEEGQVLEDPEEPKSWLLRKPLPRQAWICKMDKGNNRHSGKIKNSEDMQKTVTPISIEEIKQAVKKLKRGKSSGPYGITNEIFTEAQPQTLRIYQIILSRIAMSKNIPIQWKQGQISRLYKGKGGRGKCSNERGITLSSNIGKVFERVLNARTTQEINIIENQAGGQKGKTTSDHILLLKETISEIRRR